tara:strand:- start:845 stop:1792 length:948 start_codon:yes stop_codon:yes gene_type:complete
MIKKKFFKIFRSLFKLFLPIISKILLTLKLQRRVINSLEEKSYFSNNKYNFTLLIKDLLQNKKLTAVDVGALGGFNSENFFSKKYNFFFEGICVEPIKSEAEKLSKEKLVINKGLWSKKERKKIFILGNRLQSSSMYKPEVERFAIHDIKKKDYANYNITDTQEIDCDTLDNSLQSLKIDSLDYLKIDTQGAELEILKGMSEYTPLLIKLEAHVNSMYESVPKWNELINHIFEKNYIVIDWKNVTSHSTRIPVEMDMIFIPDFNNESGRKLIANQKEKFISLLLIFGQIKILKVIMKMLDIRNSEIEKIEDLYFN